MGASIVVEEDEDEDEPVCVVVNPDKPLMTLDDFLKMLHGDDA